MSFWFFFFQAEDGIRDLVRSRGLGDVYKRQQQSARKPVFFRYDSFRAYLVGGIGYGQHCGRCCLCLLYTSDAADDLLCVDLGGRRILKKKNKYYQNKYTNINLENI